MGFIKEFREFISRGNVLDLAVGIVIGGAFGKIVTSLVGDILMPPLGILIGGADFKELKFTLLESQINSAGQCIREAVTINYGNFIQALVDFVIIAFAIFLVVKAANRIRAAKKKEESQIILLTKEAELLTEIRDLLKKKES